MSCPAPLASKSRLRKLQRLFEHINEPAEARYLGWMTTFDEAARMALYSDAQLDLLASAAATLPDPSDADPAIVADSSAFAAAGRRDRITRAMIADLLTYLPGDLLVKVDLASMAHSLECRGPFLDHRVVELADSHAARAQDPASLGPLQGRAQAAFADLLPPPIKTRSKMGFGVPISRWFRDELKDEVRACCSIPSASIEVCSAPSRREAGRRAYRWNPRALLPPLGAAHARIVVPRTHDATTA